LYFLALLDRPRRKDLWVLNLVQRSRDLRASICCLCSWLSVDGVETRNDQAARHSETTSGSRFNRSLSGTGTLSHGATRERAVGLGSSLESGSRLERYLGHYWG